MSKEKPKGKITEDTIKERLSPLLKDKNLKLIILFGSTASQKTHKESDIDLAFLFDRPVDIVELTNTVIRLLKTNNIDVIDLQRAPPLLKFCAVKDGRLLYEKEHGMFYDFFSMAFRMYVDTKKLRDAQKKFIKNFLKEKGLR